MTRNESVAKVMGWTIYIPEAFNGWNRHINLNDNGELENETDISKSMRLAKLLQQRMVDDGWKITIEIYTDCRSENATCFYCEAFRLATKKDFEDDTESSEADTEPAAIFDLFCKCYGIA